MAWTAPVLVEICIGLEINGYTCERSPDQQLGKHGAKHCCGERIKGKAISKEMRCYRGRRRSLPRCGKPMQIREYAAGAEQDFALQTIRRSGGPAVGLENAALRHCERSNRRVRFAYGGKIQRG
jgi:coenzyme PQQ precursor peptide PqqA